ncbi:MAG TPA: DUF72 domain-containing protein [Polyangia bacterium]|nr:DUF72 domain-containing protein [Polyangia bacterium]
MQTLVGTSGYSYAPWKGRFYPEKISGAQMLPFYAGHFPTVEINNTFYRMPNPDMLKTWAEQTPDSFRFALKSPRRITHEKKLSISDDSLVRLYDAAAMLGHKLGPILFQLPPFLRKDTPKLTAFLAQLPPGTRAAFEFRHESWFVPEVFDALSARDAALCIAEAEDFTTPLHATASWGYLRLRRQDYDDAALASWASRISGQAWNESYVFLKHEDEGKGPVLAKKLIALLGES